MQEILYLEVPTPHIDIVSNWLQNKWAPQIGQKVITPQGIRLQVISNSASTRLTISETELSIFLWSIQRTTYLKIFRWGKKRFPSEGNICHQLIKDIQQVFPPQYPQICALDLSENSIFEALEDNYPQTVHFFRKMPQGETDLQRVYWWEKRWREGVQNSQKPKQVIFDCQKSSEETMMAYDIIYVGGALGAIHAAMMAQLGYQVLVVERLAFGRMNREWNISRSEFQTLIDLELFTPEEFESLIVKEYIDGFNKFFDGNNPPHLKAEVLHTPTVLNIAIDTTKFLNLCGKKLLELGGEILDTTEFIRADIDPDGVTLQLVNLEHRTSQQVRGKLLIDAMGTASPIAWQMNGKQTFNSVCPTVGAIVEGLSPKVWNSKYGDVLNSHGDISRGRQLIWELFPGKEDELTIYLFHYHQVHPENPGSLLEMYEDFFNILPEYRNCDLEKLVWKKPTFGYIPGHFSMDKRDRQVAFDRLLSIGDAASLQSPLIFTGFGSLVRNLGHLTRSLDVALKNNHLTAKNLNKIRAYQSNVAVTWLFSKGMMVPTGKTLPPQRINAILNTFFGLLVDSPTEVADTFIKDKTTWIMFNKLALKAALKNPILLYWIWEMAGTQELLQWSRSYLDFTLDALKNLWIGNKHQ
ncbi:FAD-dependent oxidoreductase [cyanobacterium endosymbiont of Epithemia clementina EcSB]|uniref:FAD-dependent oxidoreductase n=1 Tax=cyanobacterium endosymbiont of Epithemia clementina EcSB TaxID=3034674 RepID=UPI0024806794|nr:flavin-dependent dehydrogenase [cyanobacterium endosymbiont of Epithemia clementina EcSB]WGT68096.1 flavin-dependent dehydrogenase [cyanobacterium endosymbiont of Epithemia clementina EcSB]